MKIEELGSGFDNLKRSYENSRKIYKVLDPISANYVDKGISGIITGSLARKEITCESDLDAYIVVSDNTEGEHRDLAELLWNDIYEKSKLQKPGKDGTFGPEKVISKNDIIKNIGGLDDNTEKLTQRMLILLESYSVGDQNLYENLKCSIVERYISEKITNHQLGLFILNDVIRYYRTICVDFEYKTVEESKPWGIRNIKLIYSRKLIYFSGLLMCAELAQQSAERKREIFLDLMKLSPVERILQILESDAVPSLRYYDKFMAAMDNKEVREELSALKSDKRSESTTFTNLKNDGHHFTWGLKTAFERRYDRTHPIHKSVLF